MENQLTCQSGGVLAWIGTVESRRKNQAQECGQRFVAEDFFAVNEGATVYQRFAGEHLALGRLDTPVTLLAGARQVGKSGARCRTCAPGEKIVLDSPPAERSDR
jgi:hypothetical protein